MTLAIITIILTIVFLYILLKVETLSTKLLLCVLTLIMFASTAFICIKNPKMHNRISFDVIDYLIKFNSGSSMTTTKQVTTEVLKEVEK